MQSSRVTPEEYTAKAHRLSTRKHASLQARLAARKGRVTSHTEYEGPSIAEDSKKGYPGIKGGTEAAKKEMKRRQKPKLPKVKKSRPSVIRREEKSKIPKATQF